VKTTIEPQTSTNNPRPTNTPVVWMAILATIIGIAVFLTIAAATFVWLRHRNPPRSGPLN
jgi:hypothetical protein